MFTLDDMKSELKEAYLESALSTAKMLRRHADNPVIARMTGPEALRLEAEAIEESVAIQQAEMKAKVPK